MRWSGRFIALFVATILLYSAAANIGAHIPRTEVDQVEASSKSREIQLVTGLLHADIAIPFSRDLLVNFPFLADAGLPLDNPNLRYLSFGWGSKAFYTTAGSYSDITLAATFTAITGDNAVMRVVAMGDVSDIDGTIALRLTETQFERLLVRIRDSFVQNSDGGVNRLTSDSIGPHDAFYEAIGHFDIFVPCNQWVNQVLHRSGLKVGIWTPTTHSLLASLAYFAEPELAR